MRPPLPVRRSAQRSWSTCRCSHVAAAPCADHGRGCMATRALSDPACCKAACAGRLELHCDARCCPCSCSASLLLPPSPLASCCCQRRERSKLSVALWTCAFPCVPVAAAALVVRRAAGGRRKRCCRSSRRSSGRNARTAPVPLVTAGASLWRRPLRCSCASCHRRRSLRGWRRRVIRCRVRRSRRLLGIFLCWRLAACHTAPALGVPAGAGLALRKLTTAVEVASCPPPKSRQSLCVVCNATITRASMLVFIPLNVHVLTWEENKAARVASSRLYRSLRPHCRLYSFSKWRDLLCRPGSCTGHFALAAGYTLSQNDVTWVCRPADCTGHFGLAGRSERRDLGVRRRDLQAKKKAAVGRARLPRRLDSSAISRDDAWRPRNCSATTAARGPARRACEACR